MIRPTDADSVVPGTQNSPGDLWISRAAAATVAALAGIVGAISYSHMRQLATMHGQSGWHAHAFPLSVDGIEVASRRSGWLPWAALAIGTAGSLAANVTTAGPGMVSRVIAGWPALALLIAVKLLSGILERRESAGGAAAFTGDGAGERKYPASVAVPGRKGIPGRDGIPGGDGAVRAGSPRGAKPYSGRSATRPGTVPDMILASSDLLSAASTARDDLRSDGVPLTRDALAARLRQGGYRVRNAHLTALLQALRAE